MAEPRVIKFKSDLDKDENGVPRTKAEARAARVAYIKEHGGDAFEKLPLKPGQ
jgi:hypothetical protein